MAIKVEVHPYDRTLYLHLTPEAYAQSAYRTKEARETALDNCAGAVGMCDWETTKGGVHVCVFDGSVRTLVHELVHATQAILQRVGIDPLHAYGEPMAYLMDDLFSRLVGPFNAAVAATKEK